MSLSDLPNLWVPLVLLGLIVMAAVFFTRDPTSKNERRR